MAVDSPTPDDHDGEVCPNKNKLNQTSPTLDQLQIQKTVSTQIQSLETCQKHATSKAKDWARFETIQNETRKINRQAYQIFAKDISVKDATTSGMGGTELKIESRIP